jgi:hypothetical protein
MKGPRELTVIWELNTFPRKTTQEEKHVDGAMSASFKLREQR